MYKISLPTWAPTSSLPRCKTAKPSAQSEEDFQLWRALHESKLEATVGWGRGGEPGLRDRSGEGGSPP